MVKSFFECEDVHCLVRTTKSSATCQYEKIGLANCRSADDDKKYWICQGCHNLTLCGDCSGYYASSLETYDMPTSSGTSVKAGSKASSSKGGASFSAEGSSETGGSPSKATSSTLPKIEKKKHAKAEVLGRVKQKSKKKRVRPWKVLINDEWFELRVGARVKSGNVAGLLLNILDDKVDIQDVNGVVHTVALTTLIVELSTFSVEATLDTNFLSEDEKLSVALILGHEIEEFKGCLSSEIQEMSDSLKFSACFDSLPTLRNFDNSISTTFMFKVKQTASLDPSTIIRVRSKLHVVDNPFAEKAALYFCWNPHCKVVFTTEYQLKKHLSWDPKNVQSGSECMKLMHGLSIANLRKQTQLDQLRQIKASEVENSELVHHFRNLQELTKQFNFVEKDLIGKYVKRGLENSRTGAVLKVRFPLERSKFLSWNKGCSQYWPVSDVIIRVITKKEELSTFIAEENMFVEKNCGQFRKRIIVKEDMPFKATWTKFNTGERGGSRQIGMVKLTMHTNQIV